MAQPIQKYKVGQWSVSVWPNEKDGRTYYGFNLQRSYPKVQNGQPVLDAQGQKVWERQSISFTPNDVRKIKMLLFKALHWLDFGNKPAPQPAQQPYGAQPPVKPATGPFGEDEIPF